MKKLIFLSLLFSALICTVNAKSNKEPEPVADISQYYASKDQACDFILEFENQSEVDLTITSCIFNKKKRKTFNPLANDYFTENEPSIFIWAPPISIRAPIKYF